MEKGAYVALRSMEIRVVLGSSWRSSGISALFESTCAFRVLGLGFGVFG